MVDLMVWRYFSACGDVGEAMSGPPAGLGVSKPSVTLLVLRACPKETFSLDLLVVVARPKPDAPRFGVLGFIGEPAQQRLAKDCHVDILCANRAGHPTFVVIVPPPPAAFNAALASRHDMNTSGGRPRTAGNVAWKPMIVFPEAVFPPARAAFRQPHPIGYCPPMLARRTAIRSVGVGSGSTGGSPSSARARSDHSGRSTAAFTLPPIMSERRRRASRMVAWQDSVFPVSVDTIAWGFLS